MATPVRICFVYIPNAIDMNVLPPYEPPFNFLPNFLFEMRPALNITWVKEYSMGSLVNPETLEHDGCIGSIQRNESDTSVNLGWNRYYGSNVTTWTSYFSDKTQIGTMYSTEQIGNHSTHVMDFLEGYSQTHWIMTLSLLLALCSLLHFNLKKIASNRNSPFCKTIDFLTACTLNQHSHCGNIDMNRTTNCLYTFMTLLTFFTAYFLTSMIKTEMVALDPPPTIDSYQEILDKDIIPLWLEEFSEHDSFKFADKGSIERRIWDRAVERGLHNSLYSIKQLTGENPLILLSVLKLITEQKAVGLGRTLVTRIMGTNCCSLSRRSNIFMQFFAYFHPDERATEVLRVMPGSTLTRDHVRRRVAAGVQRKIESRRYVNYLYKTLSYYLFSNKGKVSEIDRCHNNIIQIPESHIDAVKLSHYRDLISIVTVLFAVALVILLYEPVHLRGRRPRRVRPIIRQIREQNRSVNQLPPISE
jgi:hypothetical protein